MKSYRENPEGEENASATKQAEREVFALRMQKQNDSEMSEPTQIDPRTTVLAEALREISEVKPNQQDPLAVWGQLQFCIQEAERALSLASKPPVEIAGMTKEGWANLAWSLNEQNCHEEENACEIISASMADKPKEGVE